MHKLMAARGNLIETYDLGKKFSIKTQKRNAQFREDIISISRKLKDNISFLSTNSARHVGIPVQENNSPSHFWALDGITVQIKVGEVVGIIGANGSGKSTFLKILARTLQPSKGKAYTRGRVVPLLQNTGGFQSEMTGRDNIMLIGLFLGMTRLEIREKFDEIVAFSGIHKFLDQQAKFYSKGMSARLGLSVVCHMNPDILLLDETLSSSDQTFYKQCVKKMEDLANRGTTILIVSHDISLLQRIGTRAFAFSQGKIICDGVPSTVLDFYDAYPPPLLVSP